MGKLIKKLWYDNNSTPPKNYIWVKDGSALEWDKIYRKWIESKELNVTKESNTPPPLSNREYKIGDILYFCTFTQEYIVVPLKQANFYRSFLSQWGGFIFCGVCAIEAKNTSNHKARFMTISDQVLHPNFSAEGLTEFNKIPVYKAYWDERTGKLIKESNLSIISAEQIGVNNIQISCLFGNMMPNLKDVFKNAPEDLSDDWIIYSPENENYAMVGTGSNDGLISSPFLENGELNPHFNISNFNGEQILNPLTDMDGKSNTEKLILGGINIKIMENWSGGDDYYMKYYLPSVGELAMLYCYYPFLKALIRGFSEIDDVYTRMIWTSSRANSNDLFCYNGSLSTIAENNSWMFEEYHENILLLCQY